PGEVNETGRMVSLALANLFGTGVVEPRQHIFLAASDNIATLVLSREALAETARPQLQQVAKDLKFSVLISEGIHPTSQVLKEIVSSKDLAALKKYTSTLPLDLTPAYDDRPFFFNQLPLSSFVRMFRITSLPAGVGVARGNLAATSTLVMLFIISL